MLDSITTKVEEVLDTAAAFLWQQFEKDMATTQAIISRTEYAWARIESYFRRPQA